MVISVAIDLQDRESVFPRDHHVAAIETQVAKRCSGDRDADKVDPHHFAAPAHHARRGGYGHGVEDPWRAPVADTELRRCPAEQYEHGDDRVNASDQLHQSDGAPTTDRDEEGGDPEVQDCRRPSELRHQAGRFFQDIAQGQQPKNDGPEPGRNGCNPPVAGKGRLWIHGDLS